MTVVNYKTIPLSTKFKFLHGFTILHLSDLHLTKRTKLFDAYFDEISAIETDIACITGDLIDSNGGIEATRHYLKKINHRHGLFVCIGNHDEFNVTYFQALQNLVGIRPRFSSLDVPSFESMLQQEGAVLLKNEFDTVKFREGQIQLYGALYPVELYYLKNKFSRKDETVSKILTDLQTASGYRLLLSHTPEVVTVLPENTVELVLSGHTHGGYVQIPNYGPLLYLSRTQRIINTGVYSLRDYQIHVSNGMVRSRLVPRIGANAEATVLKLHYEEETDEK